MQINLTIDPARRTGTASADLAGCAAETLHAAVPDGTSVALIAPDGTTLAQAVFDGSFAALNTATVECYDYIATAAPGNAYPALLVIGAATDYTAAVPVRLMRNWLHNIAPPVESAPVYPSKAVLDAILAEYEASEARLGALAERTERQLTDAAADLTEAQRLLADFAAAVTEAQNALEQKKTDALSAVGTAASEAQTALAAAAKAATDTVTSAGTAAADTVTSAAAEAQSALTQSRTEALAAVTTAVTDAQTALTQSRTEALAAVDTAASEAQSAVAAAGDAAVTEAHEAIKDETIAAVGAVNGTQNEATAAIRQQADAVLRQIGSAQGSIDTAVAATTQNVADMQRLADIVLQTVDPLVYEDAQLRTRCAVACALAGTDCPAGADAPLPKSATVGEAADTLSTENPEALRAAKLAEAAAGTGAAGIAARAEEI